MTETETEAEAFHGYRRYAIYAVPEGALHARGSAWLGWDSVAARRVPHPDLDGLPDTAAALTETPRKYGFHGTIKPPFRLAPGCDVAALHAAATALAGRSAPVILPDLEVRRLGGFVAIVPAQPVPALADLAATWVRDLDTFRAAPAPEELARRRKAGLTDRQEALLADWGYPYVFEEFRFHLTLSGKRKTGEADALAARLGAHFADLLTRPLALDTLCLMGEGADGRFRLLHRYTLTG